MLHDLRDPGTDHCWLWELASATGDCPRHTGFVTAVRLRLGAPVLEEPMVCACCGELVDRDGRHCLRRAPGANTRSHNRVRDVLLGLACLSECAAATEPQGLVPSRPNLRPADVLTTAAFGRLVALDVGVVCPDAGGTGGDACAAMHARKMDEYSEVLP